MNALDDNTLMIKLLLLSSLVLCALLIALWLYVRSLKGRLLQSVGLIDELYKITQTQAATNSANEAKIKKLIDATEKLKTDMQSQLASQYEANIQALDKKLESLSAQIERVEEQDPTLKMYSRASKLVEQGASMDDIIEASGLPKAEVEVLLALNKRK
uniref:DUF2802 domain-containing protein n=1 Tax=Ningiella ruwaisensis TaxID=2364274 RepID=UPI001447DC56|nr:DUF2802 domain-containing protein [Ningiella ruwaisensis]